MKEKVQTQASIELDMNRIELKIAQERLEHERLENEIIRKRILLNRV